MAPNKTRYATNLPAEWILAGQKTTQSSLESSKSEIACEHPIRLSDSARSNRYKTALPANWIDQDMSKSPMLRPQASMDYPKTKPHDSLKSPNVRQSVQRPHSINPSLPYRGGSGDTPPPASTYSVLNCTRDRWATNPHHSEHSTRGDSNDGAPRTRADKERLLPRTHGGMSEQAHDAAEPISPPISVGQSSSGTTTSQFHGRELPGQAPSMSPSYSVI